jgi:hypothetical protein
MRMTITLDIPDRVVKAIGENSIERVINNSMIRAVLASDDDENAYINYSDWCDLKWPVVSLWNALRDAVFRVHNKMESEEVYVVSGNVVRGDE